jgi:hypothetical protein
LKVDLEAVLPERRESLLDLAAGVKRPVRIDAKTGSGKRARFASRARTKFGFPNHGCLRL